MCGILGIYFRDKAKRVEEGALKDMCGVIRHRGPDDEGYFLYENIGLGVCRLSIIDLIKGHQPIHNEDKTLWVILNGEIYNYPELRQDLIKKGHQFYTESDTEVIVHLYEEKQEQFVNDLSGMFALAILDTKNNKLLIARDRLGIKPVYYYNKNGIFMFASELKAIVGFPGFNSSIDIQSLSHFLSMNYIPSPNTMFKDIKQLSAGHYLVVRNDALKINQYWDVCFCADIKVDEDTAKEHLLYLLKQSVKKMLRSDVPLGAFLSGGLDSSTLVALITEISGKKLKTFSVGFEEDSFDETYFAHLAARRFDTQHYNLMCRPLDLIQALPKIVWHADNLLADQAMLPLYLVSKLASEHVTVCLSGDGGDELFLGYPTYTADTYLQYYEKIPYFMRKSIIKRIINSLPASSQKLSFEYITKKFIEGAEFSPDKAHYWWRTIFNDNEKESLFSDGIISEIGSLDSYSSYLSHYNKCPQENGNLFNKFLYADIKVWLADNNLIRVDAMSMAHSLEARVPFLDHELVEFMATLPTQLKMKNGTLKYLLKTTMKGRIPWQIIKRKKAGWHVPLAKWFQEDLKDYVIETLSNHKAIRSGLFRKESIDTILQEHFRRRRNNAFKIWGLLVFFNWYEKFC
jgi:asparagine synthase (glutamine-hydrolysing)